jgi:hypothetical protein
MFLLCVFPILHFVHSSRLRGLSLASVLVAILIFGWSVWPKKPTADVVAKTNNAHVLTSAHSVPATENVTATPQDVTQAPKSPPNAQEQSHGTKDSVTAVRQRHGTTDNATASVEKQIPPKTALPEQTAPTEQPSTRKSAKSKRSDQPPIQQDCGGGNCAASVGQQGGITAGQVIIGDVPKRLSKNDIDTIAAFLRGAQAKSVISISVFKDGNATAFADDLYEAFRDGGWPMREMEVNAIYSPTSAEVRKSGKIEAYIKGETLKQEGQQLMFSDTDPIFYVRKVIEALKVPFNVIPHEDHGDDIELHIVALPEK